MALFSLPKFRGTSDEVAVEEAAVEYEIVENTPVVILWESEHVPGVVERIDMKARSAYVRYFQPAAGAWWRLWIPEERLINAYAYIAQMTNE